MNRLFRPMRLGALLPLVGDLLQHLSARLDLQLLGDRRVMPLRERHSLPPLGWHQPEQAVGIDELVRFGRGLVRADLGLGRPEERLVGKEWVRTVRYSGSPYPY